MCIRIRTKKMNSLVLEISITDKIVTERLPKRPCRIEGITINDLPVYTETHQSITQL